MGSPSLLRRAWIVKLSGSLAEWSPLVDWLKLLARHAADRPIIIVPGGGPFGHAVRNVQDVWRLDDPIAHRMALLAMEQYGLLLQGVCPSLRPAADLAPCRPMRARGGSASGYRRGWRSTASCPPTTGMPGQTAWPRGWLRNWGLSAWCW
jgi:hypothetical protein